MINNLELLKPLLVFPDVNSFYYLTILKRKQDNNPETTKSVKVIEQYAIYSINQLEEYMPMIIKDCEDHNARAYLYVNRRNAEKVALQAIKLITDHIIGHCPKAARSSYWKAVGQNHDSGHDKLWIVDVDDKRLDWVEFIARSIKDVSNHDVVLTIPTKNGYHLLSKPFNRQEFGKYHPSIDIHKDNPTILYIP